MTPTPNAQPRRFVDTRPAEESICEICEGRGAGIGAGLPPIDADPSAPRRVVAGPR